MPSRPPRPRVAALVALASSLALDLSAQVFTPPALLPGDAVVAPSAGNQAAPDIALGSGGSLVVWHDDRSSLIDSVFGGQAGGSAVPGNFDIYGVLVDPDGRPLTSAPILINGDSWDQNYPRVAWNGVEYLVVFESMRPTPNYRSIGIYGVRVTVAGAVRDPVPLLICDHPDLDERFPVVASAGGNWLVGWSNSTTSASMEGAIVMIGGAVQAKRTLVPAPVGSPPSNAQLASDGSRYVLVYSIAWGPEARASRFDAAGNSLGAPLVLSTSNGVRPAVGAHAGGFYVAWAGAGAVRGTPMDGNGVLAVPGGAPVGTATQAAVSGLGIGFDGQGWTVAYDQNPQVFVAKVATNGAVTQTAQAVALSTRSLSMVAVGNGSGRTAVVWVDHRLSPVWGIDIADVFATTVDQSGNAQPEHVVTVSEPNQINARIAGDPAIGYLIVYVSASSGIRQIMARHVDGFGNPSTPEPFLVHANDQSIGNPDVACNGREFVVTWHQLQSTATNGPPPLVFCIRCTAGGALLDPTPVRVMEGANPSTDAVGDTFLIAARYHHATLQSTAVLRGRRLDGGTGSFLDATPRVIQLGVSGLTDVVGLSDRWLAVWGAVTGAFVMADGTALPPFYAADTASSSTRFMLAANAARDEAVLAYQYRTSSPHLTDVRMRRFRSDGTSPDPLLGPVVADANQAQLRPTVASLDGEYLVLWADHRDHLDYEPGIGDVYAARLNASGGLLDPTGIPLYDDPFAEGAPMLQRTGRGRALHVVSDLRDGAYRLSVGMYLGVSAERWSTVGRGVPGLRGIPAIDGQGTLRAGSAVDVSVAGMPANAAGALVLGAAAVNVPLFGGIFVPRADLVLGMVGDAQGSWSLRVQWPAGVPAQSNFYFQGWVADSAAAQGLAATIGLRGTTP